MIQPIQHSLELLFPQQLRQPIETTYLKGKLPDMSLKSIAHYFIDKLPVGQLETLKTIAAGISNKEIPVGSTCSGFATTGMVVKALFAAINEKFNTNVKIRCMFAVKITQENSNSYWKHMGINWNTSLLTCHAFLGRELFACRKSAMSMCQRFSCWLVALLV